MLLYVNFMLITLGTIRLVSDKEPGKGRLQWLREGEWGYICYLDNQNILKLVCNQLGFKRPLYDINRHVYTTLDEQNGKAFGAGYDMVCGENAKTIQECTMTFTDDEDFKCYTYAKIYCE